MWSNAARHKFAKSLEVGVSFPKIEAGAQHSPWILIPEGRTIKMGTRVDVSAMMYHTIGGTSSRLKIEVGKEYITRDGMIGLVFEYVASRGAFPYGVKYSNGMIDTVTDDGSFSKSGESHKDLVSLADEGSRMYNFFKKKHDGQLSDKWREYED